MGVGLAVVTGVEQPRPGRELRGHVDHHLLTVGEQPLGQRAAGAGAALDRPGPLRPGRHVLAHSGVADLVGLEASGRQDFLAIVDDLDRRRKLVGIDPDENPCHAVLALLAPDG
jgi:hypothetical protein